MSNKIKYMNICITNRCNLACVMCDIWRERDKSDLPVDMIRKVLDAESLDDDLDITITGGELFLHKGWRQIMETILARNSCWLKGISTNGTRKEDTLLFLNEFAGRLPGDFSFHISVDGINHHDTQRGRKSLQKILETVRVIQEFRPRLGIKIKFTITPVNYMDIIPTFEFCRKNSLDFRVKLVENAQNYTNRVERQDFYFDDAAKKAIIRDLKILAAEKFRSLDGNALFITETIRHLRGESRPDVCQAPFQRVFLMPEGDVFTCIHALPLGNLHEGTLDEAWHSAAAKRLRDTAKKEGCACSISYHGLTSRLAS